MSIIMTVGKTRHAGWLVFGLALLLAACDLFGEDDQSEKPLDTSVLQPLAEDNYWQRVQHVYAGGEIEETFTDTGRIVVEAMRPVQVAGTSYTAAVGRVILPGDIPDMTATLEWNGPEGLYTLGVLAPDDTLLTAPQLLYKYPVQVGEHWAVPRLVYGPYDGEIAVRDTLLYTCVAQDEPFETPLGTFKTIVYHYYTEPGGDIAGYRHTYQYLVPGIGPVGTEVYPSWDSTYNFAERTLQDLKIKLTMIDYELH